LLTCFVRERDLVRAWARPTRQSQDTIWARSGSKQVRMDPRALTAPFGLDENEVRALRISPPLTIAHLDTIEATRDVTTSVQKGLHSS
jgi:hypothetical protein